MKNPLARLACACAWVVLAAGCAAPAPLPVIYSDSTAVVADSAVPTGSGPNAGTTFFTLAEVDGNRLQTSIDRTRIASAGMGMRQRVAIALQTLKPGKARLKLLGRTTYGAPIQDIFVGSRLPTIDGVIDVDLKGGGRYIVKGVLDAYRNEIWLEDIDTGQVVGDKIITAADPAALARSAASGKFTCCNLRYDGKLITDENFQEWSLIPAGARVAVVGFHGDSADVLVEGRPMVFDVYVGKELKPARMRPQELADRYAVDVNPQLAVASYPAEIQRVVRAGKVMPGMTREQVLISLGYPWPTKTPALDGKRWTYYATHDDEDEYVVVWGDDGKVAQIEARPQTRPLVLP